MIRLLPLLAFVVGSLALCGAAKPPRRARKAKTEWLTHTVKRGDTLSRLAKRYGVAIPVLRRQNRIRKRRFLMPGQVVRIKRRPVRQAARRHEAKAARKKRARRAPSKHGGRKHDTRRWVTHTIKRGDYLWRLADRYDVSIADIVRANHMGKRRRLRPGQVLRIKRRGSQMLAGGVTLPRRGVGYVRMRPQRSWGTPGTVRLIRWVYERFAARHPGSAPGMIADLSKAGGGPLRPHKSHQRGVDVDVSYYKVGNARSRGLEVVTPDTMDVVKVWDLIRLYLNTGHVTAIFMDWTLQKALHEHLVAAGYDARLIHRILQYPRPIGERRGIIRHAPGHHHHLHVRFDCVKASRACAIPKVAWIPARRVAPAVAALDAALGPVLATVSGSGRRSLRPPEGAVAQGRGWAVEPRRLADMRPVADGEVVLPEPVIPPEPAVSVPAVAAVRLPRVGGVQVSVHPAGPAARPLDAWRQALVRSRPRAVEAAALRARPVEAGIRMPRMGAE